MTASSKIAGADDHAGAGLLTALGAARDRLTVDQQIAEWCLELRDRLRRAEAFILHGDARVHHATLATEIARLRLCISLAKKAREP